MIAKIARVALQPNEVEAGVRRANEILSPALKRQKGFTKLLITADPETGQGYVIGLWESEADFQAWQNNEGIKVRAQMREAGSPQVDLETYPVLVEA